MKAKALLFVFVPFVAVGCNRTAPTTRAQTPAPTAQQAGAGTTTTDPSVNPNAAVMADFQARVVKYAELHKDLARGAAAQRSGRTPQQIDEQKAALAAKIQTARASARQGDIFAPETRPVFRKLLAPEVKGEGRRDAKAVMKEDEPAAGSVSFKINAKYPENQPKPTMPANLLLSLPRLPEPLEYRVVGQHLLLLDTASDLVVDYILNVFSA